MGEEADAAMAEYYAMRWECALRRITRRGPKDWHKRVNGAEPPCNRNQWRTRNRDTVMNMSDMTDTHLGHAIRFATTKPNHSSRLTALLEERGRRTKK